MITLEELRAAVSHTGENAIDTVLLAIVDMQGRLQGKRCHSRHFLDDVLTEGAEGCNYLLAVDVDMNTVDWHAMSSWSARSGAFVMIASPRSLTREPWQLATVRV